MMPLVGLTGACCAFPSWLHTERSALTRLRKAWASRRAVAGATDTVSSIATNAQCGVAGRLTRGVPLDRMGRGCTRPHATSYVVLRAGLRAVAHLSARLTSSFLRKYRARALITCAYAVLAVYCCGAGSQVDYECERDQHEEGERRRIVEECVVRRGFEAHQTFRSDVQETARLFVILQAVYVLLYVFFRVGPHSVRNQLETEVQRSRWNTNAPKAATALG